MNEKVYFNSHGIIVTSARVCFGSTTYALSGITSVGIECESPSWAGPVVLVAIGFFLSPAAFYGLHTQNNAEAVSYGLIAWGLISAGVLLWWFRKPTYVVLLTTAAGEVEGYAEKNEALIQRIVNAISQAIVERGQYMGYPAR